MALYTGKGDNGTSKFFGEKDRHCKNDKRFWMLGGVDELNSWVGVCRSQAEKNKFDSLAIMLLNAQEKLFIIQAEIAARAENLAIHPLKESAISELEEDIDNLELEIGPITKFSIAGGDPLSAMLDYGRAVCRRAEREIVGYAQDNVVSLAVLSYLNRLSSLLFAMARWVNKKSEIEEKNPKYS
ncbi:MAG: cob(I)yrinic acid a,c-diamide adenosyltransferase [bacterium]|nr:cob(I)yrinic acid a,c-diamide adenosyltransferase [bacterium]